MPQTWVKNAAPMMFVLTVIGSIAAGMNFLIAGAADGYPEMAARSAYALCWVVIPYCLAKLCYMSMNASYLESISKTSHSTANNSFHLCKMGEPISPTSPD